MLLTIIFVLSFQGAKAAECNSGIPLLNEGLTNVLELADPIALAHLTVSPTQFHSAPCKSKTPPELDEIEDYLFSKTGAQSKTISGVRFEGESMESLQALKNLFDGEDFEDVLTAEPACNKVVCAVERVWGAELGKKILYMRLRHGFNGSEYAHSKS